jgi:hypothetical protein
VPVVNWRRNKKGEKLVILAQAHSSILQTRMKARGKMVKKQRTMNTLFGIIQLQRRNTWQTLSCTWN